MSVRLSKAAKEFNIAVSTAIDFLIKKGYVFADANPNPNTKLSEEEYLVLQKEFQKDKSVLEKAQTLEIGMEPKRIPVTVDIIEKGQESSHIVEIEEDITIKTNTLENTEVLSVQKKQQTKKKKEEIIEKKIVEEEVTVHEVVEEIPQESEPPTVDQKQEIHAEESEQHKGLKVLGHIELESRSKKSKKSSSKKTEKIKKTEKVEKIEKTEKIEKVEKVEKKEISKKENADSKSQQQPAPVPQPEPPQPSQPPQPVEKELIKVHAPTLTGPKVVAGGKIDLSKFEEKSDHHKKQTAGEKKGKRKRINKHSAETSANKAGVTKNAGGGGQNRNKDKREKRSRGKKKQQNTFTTEDIAHQIKETLSKMATTGKSARAKRSRDKRIEIINKIGKEQEQIKQEQKTLKLTEFVTANELAMMMNIPVTEIIKTSMELGYFVSINQRLDAELIRILVEDRGFDVSFVDAEVLSELEQIGQEDDANDELVPRIPIVTVMGHVDHGKTSLLDYIRKTNIIAGEAGGITQHIGAYEVLLESGKRITFLDTPGHEAFTAMRARGAKITDIAIIVVAADDKVMPQTIEAINHAQAAGVPIIFAINKIDKPGADAEKIKTELSQMNFLVEEWGGKYQSQDISAKQGTNVEELLEKVMLEAEILDLKAHPDRKAKGTILEASLDKGRGYVAKVLVQDGSAKIGDPIIAGAVSGRIKAMYNERNQPVKVAGPSTPVLLLGLTGAPQAGDIFNVAMNEKEAREIATKRAQLHREQGMRTQKHITLDEIGRRIAIGDFKELNIIVKGDVDGSIEALSDELIKLSTSEVQVNVIHKSVGQISESDVMLASASNAIIVGFQVRPSLSARKLAEAEQIDIRTYSVIYEAKDEIKDAIEGMLSPELQEKVLSNLEVREVFKVKTKEGNITIAGCFVMDGKLTRQQKIRILRDGIVVKENRKISSLRRFKDDVKEVLSGQDCGVGIENFDDVKIGDVFEGYEIIEIKKTL
ncbi:MAG: translation initiation factor IF-2 [Bacteroidales bacterium]|nr:translation initiation factor IF-2 [Bacteroidales bacterium]